MHLRIILLLVGASFWLSVPAGPAAAQSAIKVVANGTPITSYDISQRAKLRSLAHEKGGTKEATQELIDEALQMYEGKMRGAAIKEEEVENSFAGIARQVKMTPEKFSEALKQSGIGATTLKNRLRAQIVWHALIQARLARNATVTSQDVTKELQSTGNPDVVTTAEYMLKQIIFVVPKGSPAGYRDQRRREAEAFRKRFSGCDTAVAQTKGIRDVAVRDIGRRNANELAGGLGDAIAKTAVGQATPPTSSDQGVELVAVCSKKEIQSTAEARAKVEDKLVGAQAEKIAKEYLKELQDKAVIEYR